MSKIFDAAKLRAALQDSERWERAERAMRAEWPKPSAEVIREWNQARREAAASSRQLLSKYNRRHHSLLAWAAQRDAGDESGG